MPKPGNTIKAGSASTATGVARPDPVTTRISYMDEIEHAVLAGLKERLKAPALLKELQRSTSGSGNDWRTSGGHG